MSKCKHNPEYLKYGVISIEHRGEVLPQCVVCMKTLSNASMKPSLLQRHLRTNHADKKNQDQSYFQRLAENVKRQCLNKTGLFRMSLQGESWTTNIWHIRTWTKLPRYDISATWL